MKKLEDMEDYEEGMKAYEEFLASGEEAIPWSEVKERTESLTARCGG